jgi:tetratricopeptide (TPR) repeat protein
LNDLLDSGYVKKENKEYRITPSGKTEYSRMLKSYDLDRQSILEEESKRIEEITKKTIRFFEKYNIVDDDIKFRYLNNILKMDYQKVKNSLDTEEDFNKVLLFISMNHPNQYPNHISSEEFSKKYDIKKIILDFHVLQIVEKNIYSIKFFELNIESDIVYYFQANEKKEKILRAITEDYVTRLTYLKKLYENSMTRSYYLDLRYTGDIILNEICGSLFDEGLREPLREFLPGYIHYLAYRIESQKRLIDTYDKLEGIVWQNIHEEVENYNLKDAELKRFIDWAILLIMDPYFSPNIEYIHNNTLTLIKNKKFEEAKEEVDALLEEDPANLSLIILRVKILCLLREYREAIDEISRVIKTKSIKHDQLYTLYFFSLAYSYIGLGEFEKALSVSDKLDKLFPEHPISYATKALVFGYNTLYEFDRDIADNDVVYEYIDKAIITDKFDENKARYYELKSIILLNKELFDEASEAIDNAHK